MLCFYSLTHSTKTPLIGGYRMLVLLLLVLLCACSSSAPQEEAHGPRNEQNEAALPLQHLLILGDSLSAGYGLSEAEAYPAILEEQLRAAGFSVQIQNAGVSGDTLADGLNRLPWLLRQDPDLVFVALGANDGLRGLPLERSQENLRHIVRLAQDQGAQVLLAGIDLPRNYGDAYRRDFRAIFERVAEEEGVPLLPFLLEGVAMDPALNQSDGIHPNPQGQAIIAQTVADFLIPHLRPPKGASDE